MTTIPEKQNTIASLVDAHHESHQEPPRPHMGASQLGHPCDRWLWLSFRWAVQEQFPGRILRLFRRGHLEEKQIVSDLRAIGIDIRNTTSQQTRVDFGCHVSGSLDGVIESGVPEAPKARHVAEFKTHSKKSFDALVKDGLEKSKPVHWTQCHVYMYGKNIDRALYVAVCKDDDRLYSERVRLDKAVAERAIERGKRLATAERLPEPVAGAAPDWYQCKFCAAKSFCHEGEPTEHANCRTCAHATPMESGEWHCARWDSSPIPVEFQRQGCPSHVIHPDLVPWTMKESDTDWTAIYEANGKQVKNGEGPDAFESSELLANPDACFNADEVMDKLRSELGARIGG